MASWERLELPTVRLEGACSIQLSYQDNKAIISEKKLNSIRGYEKMEKKGYQFVGWYIDKECTKRVNPGGILPSTMNLYDKWVPIWYPVVYDANGGMNSRKNPKYISVESGVVKLYPAKKKDKVFDGWYKNGQRMEFIPEGQCEPIYLKAHYKDFSTVSFETFGGAVAIDRQTNSNKRLDEFRPPMRLGYEFVGWFWDPEYRFGFTFDQTIEEDCTLYAQWKVQKYQIVYEVEGGFAPRSNPKYYTYFQDTIKLKPAVKKGYRFLGWFDERNNPLNEIRSHSLGDKKVIAHFEKLD